MSFLSLSGFGQAQDFKRSKEAGFARHLVKPVDPAELRKVLNALLQGGATDHE